jgi:hypothetical protein
MFWHHIREETAVLAKRRPDTRPTQVTHQPSPLCTLLFKPSVLEQKFAKVAKERKGLACVIVVIS